MARLAKVIEFQDRADGDLMCVRLPSSGEGEIAWGSELIVHSGQKAVLFRDGRVMASFDPGRYTLTADQEPTLADFADDGELVFRAEVAIVSTSLLRDLKWGTPAPVYVPDPVLKQIPMRANGRFTLRISDPTLFVPKIVGTRAEFRTSDIEGFIRSQYLVPSLTDAVATMGKPFQELPKYFRELGIGVRSLIAAEIRSLGLDVPDLSVATVTTTQSVRDMLDRSAVIAGEAHALSRADAELAGAPSRPSSPAASESPLAKLKQLKELLDMGAISQEEYDETKARLLKSI